MGHPLLVVWEGALVAQVTVQTLSRWLEAGSHLVESRALARKTTLAPPLEDLLWFIWGRMC